MEKEFLDIEEQSFVKGGNRNGDWIERGSVNDR